MKRHNMPVNKRGNNRGSTIIEMTLLIPVFLGCIYFYIMFFLFLTEAAKDMNEMAGCLYGSGSTEKNSAEGNISKNGSTEIIKMQSSGKLFEIRLELRKDASDAIENIRRWQFATGGI